MDLELDSEEAKIKERLCKAFGGRTASPLTKGLGFLHRFLCLRSLVVV